MTGTRERLHELVDQLPAERIPAGMRYVQDLLAEQDSVSRALREAPEDDESVSPEERAAIDAAWEDVRAGRLISPGRARPKDRRPSDRTARSRLPSILTGFLTGFAHGWASRGHVGPPLLPHG